MNKNEKSKKREGISQEKKSQKEGKTGKIPLFKIFMEENSKKKLHLIRNNSNLSNSSNMKFFHNNNLNLQLFAFKILEAKYNSTPELYFKLVLNSIIKKKKCHLLVHINEMHITTGTLKEYMKRSYTYKEVQERIPKYASYYKNYLTFFCRPFFVSYLINKKMVKHMEKVAQIFYNENYADEDKEEEKKNKKKEPNKYNIQIFSKKIEEDIENCDVCTVVTSEAAMKQIQKINNKINKKIFTKITENNNNIMKDLNLNNLENNISPIELMTIIDSNLELTTINTNEPKREVKVKKIFAKKKVKEVEPETTNSINLIIEELDNKGKNHKNDNKILIDGKKECIKNINNNCIVIQGGKTTNNINININHLTIQQKSINKKNEVDYNNKILNGLALLGNNNKIIKKLKQKNEINNSLNKREKEKAPILGNNTHNTHNPPLSLTSKHKNKSGALTLPPPPQNAILSTNSIFTKKNSQLFPNSINNSAKQIKDIKGTPLVRNSQNNGDSITRLNKYIKLDNMKNFSQMGKKTIYTTKSNYMKGILNNMNYQKNFRKNKFFTKNVAILSGERTRSTSNLEKKPKRVIYSSLHFDRTNSQLVNLKNNFDVNKNSEIMNNAGNNDRVNNNNIYMKKEQRECKVNKYKLKDSNKQINFQKIIKLDPKKNRQKSSDK